jgi:hypothetical protein
MAANSRSAKDKEMASYLRKHKIVRNTGVCCICYRPIGNDAKSESHYAAHARGANN